MRHKVPDRKALLDESNSAFYLPADNTNNPAAHFKRGFPRGNRDWGGRVAKAAKTQCRSTPETLQNACCPVRQSAKLHFPTHWSAIRFECGSGVNHGHFRKRSIKQEHDLRGANQ
ncbi:hypothetical protein [Caballeronia cordobensis]|uniref:hypothetical protein n=1 Tax=Caballeronia cordobensis TaxID=1353886 RepID=UPI0011866E74